VFVCEYTKHSMHVTFVHLHVMLHRWHKAVCCAHVWHGMSGTAWGCVHCWHRVHTLLLLFICLVGMCEVIVFDVILFVNDVRLIVLSQN